MLCVYVIIITALNYMLMFKQVYYVDHGFSEVISKSKLFELHEKFYRLPFQATKCKLAGEICIQLWILRQIKFQV